MNKTDFTTPAIESESIESLSLKLLKATADLTEKNNELTKLKKDREIMIGNLSHDLRAPITAIRSSLDYLNSGQDISPDEIKSTLAVIDRRTRTLEDMIQDMYYLFCVEDESRQLSFQDVYAVSFLEEYFFDAECDSRYHKHNLVLDVPESLSCTIKIDLQKMIRVLDNLFTNASKYTPAGTTVKLSAREIKTTTLQTTRTTDDNATTLQTTRTTGDNATALNPSLPAMSCAKDINVKEELSGSEHYLEIRVVDDGPGIPAESVSKIFERTYTVSSARTPDGSTGSGLGLAIVKAIVSRHGGTIRCKSDIGMGCCFIITLPIV